MSENNGWLFSERGGDFPENPFASGTFSVHLCPMKTVRVSDGPERWSSLSNNCHYECWVWGYATDSPDILKLIEILWPSEVTNTFPASVTSGNNKVQQPKVDFS